MRGRLAAACAVLACRAVETSAPAPVGPGAPADVSAIDRAVRRIVADRGIAHRSEQVWVVSSWRSDVEPRGVVLVVPADTAEAEDIAGAADRLLDAGFNHALVDGAARPLAARIAVAADLATFKSLGYRQWIDTGRPRRPTLTVLWLEVDDAGEALAVLREQPPFMVQAALVLTRANAPRRSDLADGLRVLELPAPGGRLDEAGWAAVRQFLDEVEREVLGSSGEVP